MGTLMAMESWVSCHNGSNHNNFHRNRLKTSRAIFSTSNNNNSHHLSTLINNEKSKRSFSLCLNSIVVRHCGAEAQNSKNPKNPFSNSIFNPHYLSSLSTTFNQNPENPKKSKNPFSNTILNPHYLSISSSIFNHPKTSNLQKISSHKKSSNSVPFFKNSGLINVCFFGEKKKKESGEKFHNFATLDRQNSSTKFEDEDSEIFEGKNKFWRKHLKKLLEASSYLVDANRWMVDGFLPLLQTVGEWEDTMRALTDEELKNKTKEFRERLEEGETLEDLQAEAFAVVREAARRSIGMRHFDVQVVGGLALSSGAVAEMNTGEGKTLVATLPAYLYALSGKGVHVITVNDYLAKRDGEWMGRVHRFLGLTVGIIQHDMSLDEKRLQYACDITYANTTEIGWDYLRDNCVTNKVDQVLRWPTPFNFAIIDEIDSVLIDDGRNPLLLSGGEGREYEQQDIKMASHLAEFLVSFQDVVGPDSIYNVDFKFHTIKITDLGIEASESYVEQFLNIFKEWIEGKEERGEEIRSDDIVEGRVFVSVGGRERESGEEKVDFWKSGWARLVANALKAEVLYLEERDYIVIDGNLKMLDEVSGRLVDKKFPEGIHQAIEAKELRKKNGNVNITPMQSIIAKVTWTGLVRLYSKRSGMTGTAKTEEKEFKKSLNMSVVTVPTNRPSRRIDEHMVLCQTKVLKWNAVALEVYQKTRNNRPVLIGTTSVKDSEALSKVFRNYHRWTGLRIPPHSILNALPKNAEREAAIVAQAGRGGAVTIATNMAGRGTDILLGGNPEMLARDLVMEGIRKIPLYNEGPRKIEIPLEAKEVLKLARNFMDLMDLAKVEPQTEKDFETFVHEAVEKSKTLRENDLFSNFSENLNPTLRFLLLLFNSQFKLFLILHDFFPKTDPKILLETAKKMIPLEKTENDPVWWDLKLLEILKVGYFLVIKECSKVCREEGERVREAGGLHVLGTELQDSRRNDDQLRGRTARQGDPGSTKFIISLEDRLFTEGALVEISPYLQMLSGPEGLNSSIFSRQLLVVQQSADGSARRNRQSLQDYEDVQEEQRQHVYDLRQHLLVAPNRALHLIFLKYIRAEVDSLVERHCDANRAVSFWSLDALLKDIRRLQQMEGGMEGERESEGEEEEEDEHRDKIHLDKGLLYRIDEKDLRDAILSKEGIISGSKFHYGGLRGAISGQDVFLEESSVKWKGSRRKEMEKLSQILGREVVWFYEESLRRRGRGRRQRRMIGVSSNRERAIAIRVLDKNWERHLKTMSDLWSGVHVRSYGYLDALEEYKIDTSRAFVLMLKSMSGQTVNQLLNLF